MASLGAWKNRIHKFIDYPPALLPFVWKKMYLDYVADRYISAYKNYQFLDYTETINHIIENNLSFVRFGDELIDMFKGIGLYYADWHQKYDTHLVERLQQVIRSNNPKLLIGLHWQFFTQTREELLRNKIPPTIWTHSKVFLKEYLNEGQTYGAALCFQPKYNPNLDFKKVLDYFKSKHIIIVTGNSERFQHIGLGKTTDFVPCPRNDSWMHYDDIFQQALNLVEEKKYPKKDVLFLVSLASAAKVFVYDLLSHDYQGWDTGQFFDLVFDKRDG